MSYAYISEDEIELHKPSVVIIDKNNKIKEIINYIKSEH